MSSVLAPRGSVGLRLHKTVPPREITIRETLRYALPHPGESLEVNVWRLKNIPNLWRGLRTVLWAKLLRIPTHYGRLFLRVTRPDGTVANYGLASLRVVTDAGVAFIVDAFQNTVELENMKYHGFGTGTNAEAAGDTALQTELTTEYATDSTRPTGTTTEGATGNIYRTVATLDPDSAVAITEHGVFSQAATGGGTLLDRSKFSAINVAATGDTLAATYDLTFTSGS